MKKLYGDAKTIIDSAIRENLPQKAVSKALEEYQLTGEVYLIAIGKAAWSMAKAAVDHLGDRIVKGIVITKYDHSMGKLPNIEIMEAGHPLTDENSIKATKKAIDMVAGLTDNHKVLFLVSGGGSALFESPLEGITLADMIAVNTQLLASGASIVEVNMVRKRLSAVKAGRFALLCAPARVYSVVLSDVIGDRLDTIASGPVAPDLTTAEEALAVVDRFKLNLPEQILAAITVETPKKLDNVVSKIVGSVATLCSAGGDAAQRLGYSPYLLTTTIDCEAREAGRMLAAIAREIRSGNSFMKAPCAVIIGGETVVTLCGGGLGGRNQELALAAAEGIAGLEKLLVFSLGSDGTDGPTDAAGGIVDGGTLNRLKMVGVDYHKMLANNDAYTVLKQVEGLIFTGATGTNVNDISVILVER